MRSAIETGFAPGIGIIDNIPHTGSKPGRKKTRALGDRVDDLEAYLLPADGPLTKKQVMAVLAIGKTKLGELMASGVLRKAATKGKKVLISRESVDAYRKELGHIVDTALPKPKTKQKLPSHSPAQTEAEILKLIRKR